MPNPLPPHLVEQLGEEALHKIAPEGLELLSEIFAHLSEHIANAAESHPGAK